MNSLFEINKIYPLKISCSASKSAATVLNHHDMGYTYESDPPQVAFLEPEPMHDVDTKCIVPQFPAMKEIDALTRNKRKRRK